MRSWGFLLGGLLVWAAHFFVLYGIASIVPGTALANWLTLVATLPAAAADAALLWVAVRNHRRGGDGFSTWVFDLAAVGAGLSLVAVLWQALPALIVTP